MLTEHLRSCRATLPVTLQMSRLSSHVSSSHSYQVGSTLTAKKLTFYLVLFSDSLPPPRGEPPPMYANLANHPNAQVTLVLLTKMLHATPWQNVDLNYLNHHFLITFMPVSRPTAISVMLFEAQL